MATPRPGPRSSKGTFGPARLPLSPRYAVPSRQRGWLALIGLGAAGAVALLVLLPTLFGARQTLSPGPLSSAHARLGATCEACHGAGGSGVDDSRCLACHERAGVAKGSFELARHAAYASGLLRAPAPGAAVACASCHVEHGGRAAAPTAAGDGTCADCHGFSSFEHGHPEFDFVARELPDDTGINFSHRHHVARVLGERIATAAAAGNPQLACFVCHNPEAGGAGFAPLLFERHCGACHLTGGESTPPLPRWNRARPLAPGLLGLEELAARDTERWALFTDPAEWTARGGTLAKSPLNHADPFVLANLRHIRATLYPHEGLAAALDVRPAGDLDGFASAELFARALDTLRARAALLRGSGSAPDEARRIDELILAAETRLGAGEVVSGELFLDPGPPNPGLSPAAAGAWRELAVELTTPCRQCHLVADGAILAVEARQRTLDRALFHHRAHYPERPDCQACHRVIPDLLGKNRLADGTFPPEPLDTAATLNLPPIAVCRECHGGEGSKASCVDCHRYHPDTRFRPDQLAAAPGKER
jgi:hypothetical protein